jgi:plastocyanin
MKMVLRLTFLAATMAIPLVASAGYCTKNDSYMKHGYMKHGDMKHGYMKHGYMKHGHMGHPGYMKHSYPRYHHPKFMRHHGHMHGYKPGYMQGFMNGYKHGRVYQDSSVQPQDSVKQEPAAQLSSVTDDKLTSASAKATTETGNSITISGMTFQPQTVTVKAGDPVTWINTGSMPHQISGTNNNSLASSQLNQGGMFKHVFDKPGTYEYFCSLHPSMTGTIIVE